MTSATAANTRVHFTRGRVEKIAGLFQRLPWQRLGRSDICRWLDDGGALFSVSQDSPALRGTPNGARTTADAAVTTLAVAM